MKISIIGAGNGGQAMAGHFSLLGHQITLYNRNLSKIAIVAESKSICLTHAIEGTAKLYCVTDDMVKAIRGAELIMITTTADAHREIALQMSPHVEDNQIIVLNPGRTLGAIDFYNSISKSTQKRLYIGEAQSLIYACRAETPGNVRIIGVKDKVYFSAYPWEDTSYILKTLNGIFNCFIQASNTLVTGLENIGAILHPSVILFNAAAIERGTLFYFYNDMTPAVAHFLEQLDKERLSIGRAYGIDLLSVSDWISFAYQNTEGATLCEKMQHNPAYYKIFAPSTLESRLLTEDLPTGILPMIEMAKIVGISTPLMEAVLNIGQVLLNRDFNIHGRTLKNIGLDIEDRFQIVQIMSR